MEFKEPTKEDVIANDPLRDFLVWWDDISQEDVDSLNSALNSAKGELEIQAYLEEHPIVLIQHLGGGHGRWVISHKRLGAELVPDFLIGEKSSLGFEWYGIELESPTASLFNSSGDLSAPLNHAIRQIIDWRVWLEKNLDYASRPREKQGLGLTDINGKLPGLILIGRRASLLSSTHKRRRQISGDLRIQIHTYDWLVEMAQGRVEALKRSREH
jgi:hypothetical protein